MKFWKKVVSLSLLLSVSAVCALGACGGKDKANGGSDSTSEEAEIRTYYGTTLEYYVTPDDPKESDGSNYGVFSGYPRIAMENMVALLQSDIFTELLFVPIVPTEAKEGLTEEEMAEVEEIISVYKASVTYSYENKKDEVDGSQMRSYIYAEIAVLKDGEKSREQAEYIRKQILDILPLYVEQNMPLMGGYNGTMCKKITRTDEIVEFEK